MKVIKIDLPKPNHRYVLSAQRCLHEVPSCGGRINNCNRYATHLVDGKPLCRQHAGQLALEYVMCGNRRYLVKEK